MQNRLRDLPQVQRLLETPPALLLIHEFGRETVVGAIQGRLQEIREDLLDGQADTEPSGFGPAFFTEIGSRLSRTRQPSLRRVINATGILIHTNLGRARLAPEALAAMHDVAAHASTLELDLETGHRGSRQDHVSRLICELTGAEAALVVNNGAAAIFACLAALAAGRPVVVSRGELVEIGGSFRMPDIVRQSGALLKEIGTTNKTHLRDYEAAIEPDTALLLKSHTSNYKIVGFTAAPDRRDLSDLARRHHRPLVEDLGSGVLIDLAPFGLPDEPVVRDVLASGVDLVTFSGDKLLGGPQAGIIAGQRVLIDQIKTHPIARAVRVDKLSLAALGATLELYRAPNRPMEHIPVLKMLAEPLATTQKRASALQRQIGSADGLDVRIVETIARAGAGSLPQQDLPSRAVAVTSRTHTANELAQALRRGAVPVMGRLSQDRLLLDVRTLMDDEVAEVAAALKAALNG